MTDSIPSASPPTSRDRLLAAAVRLVRTNGFAATSVDELCTAAGVTKGAFFHHFRSKDDLGAASARYWSETTGAMFDAAAYHAPADPLDRIFAYLDLREALLDGPLPEITCLAGTLLQETYTSSPAIAAASHAAITDHAATLTGDFVAALAAHSAPGAPDADSLARFTQTVLQGGFVLSKGAGSPEPARDALRHLRRYFALLFNQPERSTP